MKRLIAFAITLLCAQSAHATLYVLGNEAAGNNIHVHDGRAWSTVATGGLGSGAGLGSQGALIRAGDHLFAVNSGSNEVSALAITRYGGVKPLCTVASGGTAPVSVTYREPYLYVLNSDNVTGFTFDGATLTPIAGSTQNLAGTNVGPAQIEFTPGGDALVVTEKNAGAIVTYPVDETGVAGAPTVHKSNGMTPFGFAFARDTLIVSEAFGGAPGASALSSYDAMISVITPSAPTMQTAACWVAVVGNHAYTTNTGSGSISTYGVAQDGMIQLRSNTYLAKGASPIDMAAVGGYLFALDSANHAVAVLRTWPGGALSFVGNIGALPASASGLAAR